MGRVNSPLTAETFFFQTRERTLLCQHPSTYGRRPKGSRGCVRGGSRLPERLQRNQVHGVIPILSIYNDKVWRLSSHITRKYIRFQFQTWFLLFRAPFLVAQSDCGVVLVAMPTCDLLFFLKLYDNPSQFLYYTNGYFECQNNVHNRCFYLLTGQQIAIGCNRIKSRDV